MPYATEIEERDDDHGGMMVIGFVVTAFGGFVMGLVTFAAVFALVRWMA